MKTAKIETSAPKEKGLALWEREVLEKPEVRRKTTVAQICGFIDSMKRKSSANQCWALDFLDYYCRCQM